MRVGCGSTSVVSVVRRSTRLLDYSFSWKQKSGVLRVNGDVQRKRGFCRVVEFRSVKLRVLVETVNEGSTFVSFVGISVEYSGSVGCETFNEAALL